MKTRNGEEPTQLIRLDDVGLVAALSAGFLLLYRFRSLPRAAPLPKQAACGAVILLGGILLTGLDVPAILLFFTPIAWTGYILWIDGAIYSLRGESPLRSHPVEFAWLAIWSIPLWLIFELYNLRLANWIYVGLPDNWWLRQLGYAWAFATIWPGIFETAIFLRALGWNGSEPSTMATGSQPTRAKPVAAFAVASLLTGFVLLTVPVLVPQKIGAYLFGAVWLGFIFFLEPINYWTGRESLWRDLAQGDSSRLRALLWSGMLCGILWEFWNHLASARWFYTVPILQDWKIFAMPLPGYLGFPAFAVECFTMFAFVAPWLRRSWNIFRL